MWYVIEIQTGEIIDRYDSERHAVSNANLLNDDYADSMGYEYVVVPVGDIAMMEGL